MKHLLLTIFAAFLTCSAFADQPTSDPAKPNDKPREELFKKFNEQMNGVKLVGNFTIAGKDDGPLAKEEYIIQKVEKLPEGDKWLIHSRIKYGKHDVALPLPLDVKWAGNTPVITLDDMTIPGLGTFSARVVIDNDKYAGTWRHDKVGGHLFGSIEKLTAEEKAANEKAGKEKASQEKAGKEKASQEKAETEKQR